MSASVDLDHVVGGPLATATAVVLIASAIAATRSVMLTGHRGAKAAWAAESAATNGAAGEGG